MNNNIILVMDMDSFFASCEMARDKNLRKQPIGIGFELNNRGILTTSNYEARKYGLYSGIPIFKAKRLCPKLKIIKPDYKYYVSISERAFQILNKYCDEIEIASIDECYAKINTLYKKNLNIKQKLQNIKDEIYDELGITVTFGISTNRILAKLASKIIKPNGLSFVWKWEIDNKIWNMPVSKMYGVGLSLTNLFSLGNKIITIGDLAHLKQNPKLYWFYKDKIGKRIDDLIEAANGNASDIINSSFHQVKSIGHEVTFPIRVTDYEDLRLTVITLCNRISRRLNYRNLIGKTLTISLKDNKKRKTQRISLPKHTNSNEILISKSLQIMEKTWNVGDPIGFIGVSVSNLIDKSSELIQPTFEELLLDVSPLEIKYSKGETIANDINHLFGYKIVFGGDELTKKRFNDNNFTLKDNAVFKRWDEEEEW